MPFRDMTTARRKKTFPPLFDLISELLEASLPSRVVAVRMDRLDPETRKAVLHDIRLRDEADFFTFPYEPVSQHGRLLNGSQRCVLPVPRRMSVKYPAWPSRELALIAPEPCPCCTAGASGEPVLCTGHGE